MGYCTISLRSPHLLGSWTMIRRPRNFSTGEAEPEPEPAPEPEPEPAPVPEPESLAQTGASDLALVVLGGTGLLALGIASASARKER